MSIRMFKSWICLCITTLCFLMAGEADVMAQNIHVRGTVRDTDKLPVAGVSVVVKGSAIGVITDADGHYSIDSCPKDAQLSFYFLGYKDLTVGVAGRAVVDVVLENDMTALEEVVVVGFGTQKKQNLTGAVSVVDSKDLNQRSVVSAANALQGLDPSVNITFGTGSPESAASIDIRGAVSINSGSPLIIVDGIETNLNAVNPNDIESISVLKDASASAVYGAKASAGVIIVSTKNGKSENGKAKIQYSGRFSIAQNTTSTDFITTGYDYVTMTNRFYNSYRGVDLWTYNEANGGLLKLLERKFDVTENPERPWTEIGSDNKYYYYGNFDWWNYFFSNTRPQHEHNVSISGGNDKVNYYASGRYLKQWGIFKIHPDTYESLSFRAKFTAQILPKLRYSANVYYNRSDMSYPGHNNYEQTIAAFHTQVSPTFVPFNPDGSLVHFNSQSSTGSPLGEGRAAHISADNSWNQKIVNTVTINNKLEWDIVKGLRATAAYGYKMRDPLNKYRNNVVTYSKEVDVFDTYTNNSIVNSYQENHYTERQGNLDAYLNYDGYLGKMGKHHLGATAGMQYIDYKYSTVQVKQMDVMREDMSSFAVADGEITVQQTINTLKTLGFFGRVNYDYDGKYLFEASARADGSSRFAKGSRWAFFPSFSAGWRISEEEFFNPLKPVWSNLKLRLSAGSLGNQQITGYYPYISEISTDNQFTYTFDDTGKAFYADVTDPVSSGLTWETVTTYNLGLDLGFFEDRLTISTDIYRRNTLNMLTSAMTLPDVYGASTPKENAADLRTDGYEIMVKWRDTFTLGSKPFSYSITGTLGDYVSTITRFYNPDKIISDYYEGKRLGEIWGFEVEGLFASDAEAAEYQARIDDSVVNKRIYDSKGVGENILKAGDVKYKDQLTIDTDGDGIPDKGDGIISKGAGTLADPGDRKIIGNTLPRYSYSFRFDLNWNNFDLSAFFQGVGKRNWYPASGQAAYTFWGPYAQPMVSFIHKDFESMCWSEDNTDAYFPRQRGYTAYGNGALGEVNDRYLQNVAYIRLKNLSIGYTVPFKKGFISKCRVGLSGENLFYWSPLLKNCKTVDPEITLSSSTKDKNSGVGYYYPRTFSIHLDITF